MGLKPGSVDHRVAWHPNNVGSLNSVVLPVADPDRFLATTPVSAAASFIGAGPIPPISTWIPGSPCSVVCTPVAAGTGWTVTFRLTGVDQFNNPVAFDFVGSSAAPVPTTMPFKRLLGIEILATTGDATGTFTLGVTPTGCYVASPIEIERRPATIPGTTAPLGDDSDLALVIAQDGTIAPILDINMENQSVQATFLAGVATMIYNLRYGGHRA